MRRLLVIVKRKLRWPRRGGARVADESTLVGVEHDQVMDRRPRRRWVALSALLGAVMRAPFDLVSYLVPRADDGAEEAWMSGDLSGVAAMNHIMVSDGMRYVIYV